MSLRLFIRRPVTALSQTATEMYFSVFITINQISVTHTSLKALDQSGLTLCYQKNSLLEPRWSVLVLVDLQDTDSQTK